MKRQGLIASAIALFAMASTAVALSVQPLPPLQDEDPLPSADRFATHYIMLELALGRSQSVRVARERCTDCYSDHGGSAEVMIGLLGMGGHPTTDSLLSLLAVQLDAGAAESRSCEFAKRGKGVIPALTKFDAAVASEWCGTTFNRLRQHELSKVNDVSVKQMCRPPAEIEADRRSWIEALQSGEDLLAESGPC